ncbi:MAG: DUF2339 domain-containing protein [Acidimicrobiales bacterium]
MAELAVLGVIALAIVLSGMNQRLRRLEEAVRAQYRSAATPPATAPPSTAPPEWALPPPRGPVRPREPIRLRAFGNRTVEQVVSENLVAIVGGLLVLAGAVFFLSLAISRGWIGETGRVVIALVAGSALVASGLRLGGQVRRVPGASDRQWAVGSLHGVLCGVGIAILFLGAVVGTRVYEVLGLAGLPLAVAVGALAIGVAVKWHSQDLAGFGIGGALAAPILVDAPADGSTAAFVVVALLASSAVIIAMGWPWLLAVTLVTTAPQVAVWIAPDAHGALVGDLSVLAGWNAIILAAAVSAELRQPGGRLRASFASISFLAASTTAVLGANELEQHEGGSRAWWLAVVAAIHLFAASAAWVVDRRRAEPTAEQHPTPVWCLLIASAFAAMAVAAALDAAAVVAVWAFEAVALWWLSESTSDGRARIGAYIFGALTVLHVVVLDAPASQLAHGSDDLWRSLLALAAVAIAAACGAGLERRQPEVASRFVLASALAVLLGASLAVVTLVMPIAPRPDTSSISVGAQLGMLALWAGVVLLLCTVTALHRLRNEWIAFALILAALVPLWGFGAIPLRDLGEGARGAEWGIVAGLGAFGTLAAVTARRTASAVAAIAAAMWTAVAAGRLLFELEWIVDAVWTGSRYLPHAAVLAFSTCASAGFLHRGWAEKSLGGAWSPETERRIWRASALGLTALVALLVIYVLSDAVVSGLTSGPTRGRTEQDAQMALSLLWGVLGVTAFVIGATQRVPGTATQAVRRASLTLLAVSVLKVVLLDTRQLESTFRVLVLVGLGSLLLLGAWLDQRIRAAG